MPGLRLETPEGGIDAYMAMADSTGKQLLESDSPLVKVLRQYDTYFREGCWAVDQSSAIALMLYMNAYQMFLAAARIALGGHGGAVFPTLRTALESAAFGSLMVTKPELEQVWIERHKGENEKKACRDAFVFKKAVDHLKSRAPDIHSLALEAYEGAIDYGAHPNIKGVFGHVLVDDKRNDNMVAVTQVSLYDADHVETIRGLCACLDFALAVIGIIVLSQPNVTGADAANVAELSNAKNAATDLYSSATQ